MMNDFLQESYGLNWLGKSYARILATDNTTTLLTADTTHNNKAENINSNNLLLKGDNLEILKHLCHAYHKQVKMIYIDPPYNTGGDGFVYQDNKKFTVKKLQELAGISENKAQQILDFTQSNSNSHSAWLTFMYPRLYVAKQLLADNGVVFVSIDDNELAQLRLLMDEIFGEQQFVAQFSRITKKAGKTTDLVAKNTDYLLCYANKDAINFKGSVVIDDKYKHKDKHYQQRGYYKLSQTLDYSSIQYSPSLDYEIELDGNVYRAGNVSQTKMQTRQQANPSSDFCWRWSKKRFEFGLKHGFIVVKNGRIYTKTYQKTTIEKQGDDYQLVQISRTKAVSTLEFTDNQYSNDNAKKHLAKHFDETIFEYPKPTTLIKKLADMSTTGKDIILDFFAGSGTTADAVMQLNAEDGGDRQFILVQLPELINPNKNKTAYNFVKNKLGKDEPTIFDITKERIIRSAKKIYLDNSYTDKNKSNKHKADKVKQKQQQDMGFKVFATMPIWQDYQFEADKFDANISLFDETQLGQEDIQALLTTWKTHDDCPLTEDPIAYKLDNYTAYLVNTNSTQKLYLMDHGFTTTDLDCLLHCLNNDKNLNPSSIIAFGYQFKSKHLRELSASLQALDNEKQLEVAFLVRY